MELAVKLILGGYKVITIARGRHLKVIKENGLMVDSSVGRQAIVPWRATDNTNQVGRVDAKILGVKGNNLEEVALACLPMLGRQTLVVPFLNGVEARERLVKTIYQRIMWLMGLLRFPQRSVNQE